MDIIFIVGVLQTRKMEVNYLVVRGYCNVNKSQWGISVTECNHGDVDI
jgi:hypothetical protein